VISRFSWWKSRYIANIINRLSNGALLAISWIDMLKIFKSEVVGRATFSLSGRIESRHLSDLRTLIQIDTGRANRTLDLKEVKLVDREAVGFLAACESRGIELKNCPSYVRMWIEDTRS
jgi:hypothetical protein